MLKKFFNNIRNKRAAARIGPEIWIGRPHNPEECAVCGVKAAAALGLSNGRYCFTINLCLNCCHTTKQILDEGADIIQEGSDNLLYSKVDIPEPSPCLVPGCTQQLRYDTPWDLCEQHWLEWFNHEDDETMPEWMKNVREGRPKDNG